MPWVEALDWFMTPPPDEPKATALPLRVVLAPDLMGRAFTDPDTARVFRLWRDGRMRPVLNRTLLLRYLRLLRSLGLDERLLRRWGWWFTSSQRAEFREEEVAPDPETVVLCNGLASRSGAEFVVHGGAVTAATTGTRWVTASELLSLLAPAKDLTPDTGA